MKPGAGAKAALAAAIAGCRGRERGIGRARLFAERSRMAADPGTIAARRMLKSLG